MNKSIVIYQSKYGSTKKYAEWIAQALTCDLAERGSVKADHLKAYDTIIYGGGLYAGGVAGFDLIIKNFDKLADKHLVLFTCGLADINDPVNTGRIMESLKKELTSEMREKIKIFHLRGAIDYAKLSIPHKTMMAMLHKMILKKGIETLRNEDKEMLETYGKNIDFTDPETIKPLLDYVQSLAVNEI